VCPVAAHALELGADFLDRIETEGVLDRFGSLCQLGGRLIASNEEIEGVASVFDLRE
jgi:hypothetical protein